MAKKGTIILVKDHSLKGIYIHRNAEIEKIGKKIVKLCRAKGIEGLKRIYDNLVMVQEDDPMTEEQREAYKRYIPEQLWKPDLTWREALAYTKDAVKPLQDEYPYQVDYADYIPCWTSRYQYCIDLDQNYLMIAEYGYELIAQEGDLSLKETVRYPHKIKPFVVGKFPLDAIPEDWLEQCLDAWNHVYLTYVPMDAAAVASGNGSYVNGGQYDPDQIGFYYGR